MFSLCLMIIISRLWFAEGEEPQCSKYDFEEKVLEKLIRMEFETERIKLNFEKSLKELETLKESLKDTIEDANQAKSDMEKETNSKFKVLEEGMINKLQTKIEEFQMLSERVITPRVVFRSRLDAYTTVSVGQTLVFPTVLLNEGGGYNPSTGIFTTPVNGTYLFTLLLCPANGKGITYNVVEDGAIKNTVHIYGGAGHSCHSSNINLILSYKQTVSINISYINPTSYYSLDGDINHRWNMFTGTLINT